MRIPWSIIKERAQFRPNATIWFKWQQLMCLEVYNKVTHVQTYRCCMVSVEEAVMILGYPGKRGKGPTTEGKSNSQQPKTDKTFSTFQHFSCNDDMVSDRAKITSTKYSSLHLFLYSNVVFNLLLFRVQPARREQPLVVSLTLPF